MEMKSPENLRHQKRPDMSRGVRDTSWYLTILLDTSGNLLTRLDQMYSEVFIELDASGQLYTTQNPSTYTLLKLLQIILFVLY